MRKSQPLIRKIIDQIFDDAEHQGDYVVALYKIVYPSSWDMITKVNGWPSVSKVTNEYLFQKAIKFDKEHHPDVIAGGAWLSNGFGTKDDMKDWVVTPCDITIAA